jgi:hypothetical protein
MMKIILLLLSIGITIGVSSNVSAHAGRCKDYCNADYNVCVHNGGWSCEAVRAQCLNQCDCDLGISTTHCR